VESHPYLLTGGVSKVRRQRNQIRFCCAGNLVFVFLCLAVFPALRAQGQTSAEAIIPQGTRISLQLSDGLSTKLNHEGDAFSAVTREPISVGDHLVIPKGSVVSGSISRIVRPGRFKGKAVMNLLFQSIRIPGHGQLAIVASLTGIDDEAGGTVYSEGRIEGKGSEGKDAAQVVKPGLIGGGIGGLTGGGKGAAIGAGVGAAVGLATVFGTRGKDLEFRRGISMEITLDRQLLVTPEGEGSTLRNRN
jgi:hypothetical protein